MQPQTEKSLDCYGSTESVLFAVFVVMVVLLRLLPNLLMIGMCSRD
jgi:hypothetical protein